MNINSNNFGIGTGLVQASGEPVQVAAPKQEKSVGFFSGRSVKIVENNSDPVIDSSMRVAIEQALNRKDPIAKIFNAAFGVK